MKNRKIAEVLKAYRKMNNLSVRDVTELLEEKSLKVAEKILNLSKTNQVFCITHLPPFSDLRLY
mgnify:CR=1 FL=1